MECFHCRLGHFHPTKQPYLAPFGDTMMVVPEAPALRCDMCGSIHFQEGFLEHLQYLLDRLGEPDPDPHPLAIPTRPESPETWSSGRSTP